MNKNNYNRIEAVRYAILYAERPNPDYSFFNSFGDGGGDCSNFVSQCLAAGGAPIDFGGSNPWWYKKDRRLNKRYDKWSLSWSVAHSLYVCLKVRGKKGFPGLQGIEVESMSELEPGDIIQYENVEGRIYHSAIITNFILDGKMREPLVSQHSFNALNISYFKPIAMRMHLMKIFIK